MSSNSIVVLTDGLSVPLPALQLLWSLEDRRLTIGQSDHGTLLIGPRHRLTPGDRRRITQYRDTLLQLVSYAGEVVA